MIRKFLSTLLGSLLVLNLSGCSIIHIWSFTNDQQDITPSHSSQASFKTRNDRATKPIDIRCVNPKKQNDVLVLLALSGGGSRAAYFSALSMLEMEQIKVNIPNKGESNLLNEVDVISSVSGGSLPAAYYVSSGDKECSSYSSRIWNRETIDDLMTRNYLGRWIGSWFLPENALKFWLTDFDRTDIMAQTLADNMYDQAKYKSAYNIPYATVFDNDLTFRDLNPLRPNIIINATRGSQSIRDDGGIPFGHPFTFTNEDFVDIGSSIESYSLARAVMASATFPGVFNFMTLRDYERNEYLHVFDGGNSDNLGLTSLKRVIWESRLNEDSEQPVIQPKKIIVILVDAFTKPKGANPKSSDPRNSIAYIVDTNFLDATDSLLDKIHDSLIIEYQNRELFPYGTDQTSNNFSFNACMKFFHWYNQDKKNMICSKEKNWWSSLNNDIRSKIQFVHLSLNDAGDFSRSVATPTGDYTASDYEVFQNHGGHWTMPEPGILRKQLNDIPTNFNFDSKKNGETQLKDDEAISCAVPTLFGKDSECKNSNGQKIGTAKTKGFHNAEFQTIKRILENPDIKLE